MGRSNPNFISQGLLFTWAFVHLFHKTATLPPALWQALHHLAHMLLPVSSHLGEGTHGPICQPTCLYSFIQKGEICFTINVCILWSRIFFFIFLRERKKMRQWETETTLGEASWSFIPLKCFYHPTWKEPACLLGKICAKVWIPGVRTRTKFPSWDRRETVNRLDVRLLESRQGNQNWEIWKPPD